MSSAYATKFKKLPDFQLVEIIMHAKDYDALAVEAAQAELNSRNIDANELDHITQHLEGRHELPLDPSPYLEEIQGRFSGFIKEIIHVINPIGLKSTQQIIKIIALLFILNGLFLGKTVYRILEFAYNTSNWYYSLPELLITLPIFGGCFFAGVFLWRMDKKGWIGGMIILTYLSTMSLAGTVQSIYWRLTMGASDFFIIPPSSILLNVIHLVLLVLVMWYLYRENVRRHFSISGSIGSQIIGWTMLTSVIITYFMVIRFL